jgi:hypothetical protein
MAVADMGRQGLIADRAGAAAMEQKTEHQPGAALQHAPLLQVKMTVLLQAQLGSTGGGSSPAGSW